MIHTFALVSRIYISAQPPITNLYSTAVFIGWALVVTGIVLELIFRLGFGNLLSSVAGFAALLVAHFLAGSGDTIQELEAVLDTRFWLSTHVVIINLGYATTYAAGLLGIFYVLAGVVSPALGFRLGQVGGQQITLSQLLGKVIYGMICFAILFSFIGTVLGGLWADDSWGRFWGWDPKENGALLIVHLERHRAPCPLGRHDPRARAWRSWPSSAICVTSWSWFGVNELGVGLHSYGFTEGVLPALAHLLVHPGRADHRGQPAQELVVELQRRGRGRAGGRRLERMAPPRLRLLERPTSNVQRPTSNGRSHSAE